MEGYCTGCKYNTPKTRGGQGRICNGYTRALYGRCPEWVINEANKSDLTVHQVTHEWGEVKV